MKIGVVGSNGYLSKKIVAALSQESNCETVLRFGRKEKGNGYLDLLNPAKFDYSVLKNIDYILFTAAVSSPEKCEVNYETAYQINVAGTKQFISNAIKKKCRVIFFSSDAVFGFTPEIVDENSQTVGETAYGKMKKEVEDQYVSSPYFKTLRLSYVFSEEDKYSSYLRVCNVNHQIAEVYHPFYRNCITMPEVIQIIYWLMGHWDCGISKLNAGGPELISRLRIADEWSRFFKNDFTYQIVTPPENFFKYRPARLEMKSLYLNKILDDYNHSFSEKVKKILLKYKEIER